MPGTRLELARPFNSRGILSPLCLPFHHPGIFPIVPKKISLFNNQQTLL